MLTVPPKIVRRATIAAHAVVALTAAGIIFVLFFLVRANPQFLLLWLVIGYLRVSQVGLADDAAHGVVAASAPRLLPASDGPIEAPRGVPFCPVDGITYPRGTVYCARDESSLVVNCANCGTRIGAADDRCYHCGTNRPQADVSI